MLRVRLMVERTMKETETRDNTLGGGEGGEGGESVGS